MAAGEEVERRLRDADVALDADDDDLAGLTAVVLDVWEKAGDGGDPQHAEGRFVGEGDARRGEQQRLQLRHRVPQLRGVLRRHHDGDAEGSGCAEDFLCCEEAGWGKERVGSG